jgi:hypothetical protein
MVSRLLHLMVIDILTTGVALRLGSAQLRPVLQEIKKNLRLKRYVPVEGARGSSQEPREFQRDAELGAPLRPRPQSTEPQSPAGKPSSSSTP